MTAQTGKLMLKIYRHFESVDTAPPTTGPRIAPKAPPEKMTPRYVPQYHSEARPHKTNVTSISIPPAPILGIVRPAVNIEILFISPAGLLPVKQRPRLILRFVELSSIARNTIGHEAVRIDQNRHPWGFYELLRSSVTVDVRLVDGLRVVVTSLSSLLGARLTGSAVAIRNSKRILNL